MKKYFFHQIYLKNKLKTLPNNPLIFKKVDNKQENFTKSNSNKNKLFFLFLKIIFPIDSKIDLVL